MKEEFEFFESQRFNRWLSVLIMIVIGSLAVFTLIAHVFIGKAWGNNPADDILIVVVTLVMALTAPLFLFLRLDTVINKEGVFFRMFPFHTRFKFKSWDRITKAEVMRLTPFRQLDGKGVPFNMVNLGRSGMHFGIRSASYTISGHHVLEITLINNRKLFLGTRRPEDLTDFLNKLDADRRQK